MLFVCIENGVFYANELYDILCTAILNEETDT